MSLNLRNEKDFNDYLEIITGERLDGKSISTETAWITGQGHGRAMMLFIVDFLRKAVKSKRIFLKSWVKENMGEDSSAKRFQYVVDTGNEKGSYSGLFKIFMSKNEMEAFNKFIDRTSVDTELTFWSTLVSNEGVNVDIKFSVMIRLRPKKILINDVEGTNKDGEPIFPGAAVKSFRSDSQYIIEFRY